ANGSVFLVSQVNPYWVACHHMRLCLYSPTRNGRGRFFCVRECNPAPPALSFQAEICAAHFRAPGVTCVPISCALYSSAQRTSCFCFAQHDPVADRTPRRTAKVALTRVRSRLTGGSYARKFISFWFNGPFPGIP